VNRLVRHHNESDELPHIHNSTIEFLLVLGDSRTGIVTRYEVADMYGISVDKIEKILEAARADNSERNVWESV
jgi:hypothetical protein